MKNALCLLPQPIVSHASPVSVPSLAVRIPDSARCHRSPGPCVPPRRRLSPLRETDRGHFRLEDSPHRCRFRQVFREIRQNGLHGSPPWKSSKQTSYWPRRRLNTSWPLPLARSRCMVWVVRPGTAKFLARRSKSLVGAWVGQLGSTLCRAGSNASPFSMYFLHRFRVVSEYGRNCCRK